MIKNLTELDENRLMQFIWNMHRYETDENPHVFGKGVRCCLIALGYPEEWVNGDFYDKLSDMLYVNTK